MSLKKPKDKDIKIREKEKTEEVFDPKELEIHDISEDDALEDTSEDEIDEDAPEDASEDDIDEDAPEGVSEDNIDEDAPEGGETSEEPEEKKKAGTSGRKGLLIFLLLAVFGIGGWFCFRYFQPEQKGDRYAAKGAYQEAVAEYRVALSKDPQNAELKAKICGNYLSWCAQVEAAGDYATAYQLMTEALAILPDDTQLIGHRDYLVSCRVLSTLREAHLLGNTKQALSVLEGMQAQIPDVRLQEAIDELTRSQWKETSRAVYLAEGAIDSYFVRAYDTDGTEIKQTLFNNDGSVACDQEFYYENGQISGMIRYENGEAVRFGEWGYEEEKRMYIEYSVGAGPLYAVSYSEEGLVLFTILYRRDESVAEYTEYEYDPFGLLMSKTEFGNDDVADVRYLYTYDASGRLQQEQKCDGQDRMTEYTIYERDAEGRTIHVTHYDAGSNVIDTQDYIYDTAGHITEYLSKDAFGEILARYEYEYNAEGQLVKELVYAVYDVLYRTFEYEYDANGNLIKKTEYYGDGIFKDWIEYSYEFYELQ